MSTVEKGESGEKELYEILKEKGFSVIRIPQSGRSMPLPDLIVVKRGVLYGFEVKFSTKQKAHFSQSQFDNLIDWLLINRKEGIPARGFLAVKILDNWEFVEVDYDTLEVNFPNDNAMNLEDLFRLMRRRIRKGKRINCSIRIMGEKDIAYRLVKIIKEALEKNGFKVYSREYVMYKDKANRVEVDKERTRIYITISK